MNEDTKRGTGRTTRMLLAVAEHLAKDPENKAVIVIHSANWGWMRGFASSLLSEHLLGRVTYQSYAAWQAKGMGKREFHFFDHHCFYQEVMQLRDRLGIIEKDFMKYDLES